MNYQEIIDQIKPELEKVINFFDRELAKIRTSRATPSLVEDLEVNCFGQKFPLRQLAAISLAGPRQISIQPWDKSYIEPIVAAISKSSLGSAPIVDKDFVRISLPQVTEEYRKELLRILSGKQEEAKKTIRRWREDAWDKIQGEFREGKIREDDKFRGKDKLQDLVEEYNKKIEEIVERKRKEIME